jgi:poly(A) polymerase
MKREEGHPGAQTLQLLERAAQHFSDHHCSAYLVGGSVRDLLLNEPCADWDIVTDGDAPRLARQLANKLGGYYARMHEKASRVVVKHENGETILDIAPQKGESIETDLRLRDFTINAIAVELASVARHFTAGTPFTFIDPLHGANDLRERRLRVVSERAFQADPLRLLRAVRFMMRYHLSIEDRTAQLLTHDAPLLMHAAPQRIHDELYAILRPAGAIDRLRFLDQHGLLTTLIPELIPARGMRQPELHHWDVFEHSLESVSSLERLTALLQQEPAEIARSPLESAEGDLVALHTLLYEAQAQGVFQFAALTSAPMKLAALLHDIGKPITCTVDEDGSIHFYNHPQAGVPLAQTIMQRLSASTQDRRLVQQIVANHMRPGQLAQTAVTERAIRRYFVDLGPAGLSVALVALADYLGMRGPEPLTVHWPRHLVTVRLLFTRYIRERERILPPRLIEANELMRRLNIEPGPRVGQLLEYIADAQAEGRVHSRQDALWLAEEKLHQMLSDS